ncbi:hypothetical protein LGK95_19525 [Clostridium algoriphilum]|uniref:hypothetical protein n=1 Tax=Clostridium algoriphilum TaxID=198347 RepID=UPI001CF12568|nr:hypothetical protein [Clostridium algoriphilum]MCB2295670.1 hypothetical protein [Clostridium algoriphilum]
MSEVLTVLQIHLVNYLQTSLRRLKDTIIGKKSLPYSSAESNFVQPPELLMTKVFM